MKLSEEGQDGRGRLLQCHFPLRLGKICGLVRDKCWHILLCTHQEILGLNEN